MGESTELARLDYSSGKLDRGEVLLSGGGEIKVTAEPADPPSLIDVKMADERRYAIRPDEAYHLGRILSEIAIDHGFNPDTGEVSPA